MKPAIYLQAMGATSALGADAASMRARLFAGGDPGGFIDGLTDCLTITEAYSPGRPLSLGCVPPTTVLPDLTQLPAIFHSRNNALAAAALEQIRPQINDAIQRFGPARLAVVVGTSTSGVREGEAAAHQWVTRASFPDGFDFALQELGNTAEFVAHYLGVTGPAYVVSTACSSGAKALAAGARLLQAGWVDAVVAGGVDALCQFTVSGFSALELVSATRCNPLSVHRKGINLGEGSAFFLMRRGSGPSIGPVRLAGWGESQDAHHMSAPDPQGVGAMAAMQQGLERAGIAAAQVDYINLHGTATLHNDAMETLAIHRLFGSETMVSSTKPLTGHTLAAAGALEAAVAWHVLHDNDTGRLPAHWWDGAVDSALSAVHPVAPGESLGRPVRHVLSNSFAFGGSNAALVLAA